MANLDLCRPPANLPGEVGQVAIPRNTINNNNSWCVHVPLRRHFLSLTVSMSPQRVADAANPHPYPFVVRQERLPPDDLERNGKPRKSKPRPRADRSTRQEEEIRFNTGPRNLRGAPVNRGSRRPFRMLGRYDRGYDDHTGTVLHPKLIYLPLASFY